jgi:hypothetical protein
MDEFWERKREQELKKMIRQIIENGVCLKQTPPFQGDFTENIGLDLSFFPDFGI